MKRMMIGAVTLLFAGSAFALTLKERKKLEEWNKEIDMASPSSAGRVVKRTCEVEIPLTLNEDLVTPFMEANASAAGYCDAVREGMSIVCKDAMAKKALVEQVKQVTCKAGPKGSLDFKLKGKTLEVTVGPGVSNIYVKARKYLEDNLK